MAVWVLILTTITYKEVQLWSKPVLQAQTWYVFNMESERARINYNFLLTLFGEYQTAYENHKEIFYSDINSPGEALMWLQLRCFDHTIPYPPNELTLQKLSEAIFSNAVYASLDDIATLKNKGECAAIDNNILIEYIAAISTSKHYQQPKMQRTLLILKSKFLVLENRFEEALLATSQANTILPTPDTMINIAYLNFLVGNTIDTHMSLNAINTYCLKHPIECINFRAEIKTLENNINNNYSE
jgi:hypothetical protein